MSSPTGNTENKARLKEIIGILSKHNVIGGVSPEKLRLILQDLGPTFVKLGQILSMRPDMIPAAYCEELQKLRSEVKPMAADEVRRVIESSLSEPFDAVFQSFDEHPLGSASIAQVHKATLRKGGTVVVKVQREGIHDIMSQDIALLRKAAKLLKIASAGNETIDLNMVLDEMWVVSQEEMNFTTEAQNAEEFYRLNQEITYVTCPQIYREYTTARVLVMECVDGTPIDDKEALQKLGYDLNEIGTKLCVNYMKQILDDGFFHADPHPGNLRIRDGQIVWLDMGMVGHLTARDQACFQKGVAAVAQNDVGGVMEVILAVGKHNAPINREALYADVDAALNEYVGMPMAEMDLGQMMQRVLDLARKHKISMPPGVTMLARGLCTLQGVVADISPEVSVIGVVSERFAKSALGKIDFKSILQQDAQAVYQSSRKSLEIPSLISDTLKQAHKGELRLRMEMQHPKEETEQKNARLRQAILCALSCTLLLGGSVLTFAPLPAMLWGLNLPALIGLLSGVGMAAWLLRLCFHKK